MLNITRIQAQIISTFIMAFGVLLMLFTHYLVSGVAMVGISVWIMMMSESILLSKVQLEMMTAMETISRKKEQEVEQVLYFLKQSSIVASPFKSIDGAKQLCSKIKVPAMVLSVNHQIIKANKLMHDILSWKFPNLDNVHAHTINDPLMMSKIGEWAAQPKNVASKSMVTQYVYINKNGEKIAGLMHATKISVQGFFVLFYPAADYAFSYDEIKEIIINSKLQV